MLAPARSVGYSEKLDQRILQLVVQINIINLEPTLVAVLRNKSARILR